MMSNDSDGDINILAEQPQQLTGSKRPRRMATLKKEDSQDPYIYMTTTGKPQTGSRKPRTSQAQGGGTLITTTIPANL